MDKTYLTLFTELAHASEVIAEQVMELNKSHQDDKGIETAQIMRDDFAQLYDMMRKEDFDPDTLGKREYAKLLVGAIIVANQLDNKIKAEQKALDGYKIDTIPKLERIVNETNSQEEIQALSNELFAVKSEEKTDT